MHIIVLAIVIVLSLLDLVDLIKHQSNKIVFFEVFEFFQFGAAAPALCRILHERSRCEPINCQQVTFVLVVAATADAVVHGRWLQRDPLQRLCRGEPVQ